MGKPTAAQATKAPAPKQRAAASAGPARDGTDRRTRSTGSTSPVPEVPAAKVPGLDLTGSGGFIWS